MQKTINEAETVLLETQVPDIKLGESRITAKLILQSGKKAFALLKADAVGTPFPGIPFNASITVCLYSNWLSVKGHMNWYCSF